MNINALKREMKKLEKFFVDPSGEIYTAKIGRAHV